MSEPSASLVDVTVTGDSDIQFFIVDHTLRLMDHVSLPWSGRLSAGLYRFKFRRGTTVVEESVYLDPAAGARAFVAPRIAAPSSAPFGSSSRTHEYHMAAASDHSRVTNMTLGRGSQLFLFVRDWTTREAPLRTDEPAAGLQLLDANRVPIADVARDAVTGGTGDEDRWTALNVELDPGSYLLRLDTRDGTTLEQTVVVSRDWQTQVFLLLTDFGAGGTPDWRADLANASVLMARVGHGFSPTDDDLRLTDTARTWLAAQQRATAEAGLARALERRFDNPMLGLYAAHALIVGRGRSLPEFRESLDAKGDSDFDEATLRSAVQHLSDLVPDHPDLIALQLWLGLDSFGSQAVATPPMLVSSWTILVAASAQKPYLIPRGSLSSRVGGALYGSGPWLRWRPDLFPPAAESATVDFWGAVEAVQRALEGKRKPGWYKRLNAVQHAVLQQAAPTGSRRAGLVPPSSMAAPEPSERPSLESLVESMGLPLSTLEDTALGLTRAVEAYAASARFNQAKREAKNQ